jgi:hypothetical protein
LKGRSTQPCHQLSTHSRVVLVCAGVTRSDSWRAGPPGGRGFGEPPADAGGRGFAAMGRGRGLRTGGSFSSLKAGGGGIGGTVKLGRSRALYRYPTDELSRLYRQLLATGRCGAGWWELALPSMFFFSGGLHCGAVCSCSEGLCRRGRIRRAQALEPSFKVLQQGLCMHRVQGSWRLVPSYLNLIESETPNCRVGGVAAMSLRLPAKCTWDTAIAVLCSRSRLSGS